MTVKFIDLFCGIGGFHQGIKNVISDSECVLASDFDKNVQKVYEDNYGVKVQGDICDITDIPECDIICGGFPCQPFSVAQWKDVKAFKDPRGNVFLYYLNTCKSSFIFPLYSLTLTSNYSFRN